MALTTLKIVKPLFHIRQYDTLWLGFYGFAFWANGLSNWYFSILWLDDVTYRRCCQGQGRSQISCLWSFVIEGNPTEDLSDFPLAVFYIDKCHFFWCLPVVIGVKTALPPRQQSISHISGVVTSRSWGQTFCMNKSSGLPIYSLESILSNVWFPF